MVIVVCISPSGPKGNVNLHGVNIFQLLVEREPDSPCHCLIINSQQALGPLGTAYPTGPTGHCSSQYGPYWSHWVYHTSLPLTTLGTLSHQTHQALLGTVLCRLLIAMDLSVSLTEYVCCYLAVQMLPDASMWSKCAKPFSFTHNGSIYKSLALER